MLGKFLKNIKYYFYLYRYRLVKKMNAFNFFQKAFYSAKMARKHCQYDEAIFHINNALKIYPVVCASGHYDPHLWSQILFVRAGIFMKMHHYKDATQDIIRAFQACPQTVQNYPVSVVIINHTL